MNESAQEELRRQMVDLNEVSNPANDTLSRVNRVPRIPMSAVRRRLEVKPIPGYYLYFFKEENVPAAMEAYYEFVKRGEVSLNPTGIGSDSSLDGSTDLGTNVSIIAGQNAAGAPVRLVLMKLREEWHREDMMEIEKRNSLIMQAIYGTEAATVGEGGEIKQLDSLTYIDKKRTALFNKPVRKATIGKRGR
jgi:hypothetical protein